MLRFAVHLAVFALAGAGVETILAQCPISPATGVKAAEFDTIFTQDGPGKGIQPKGSAGWVGGDSTYSVLLPNGDTAFFFSDSYIAEWPKTKGDGTVTRAANGLRTTEINCGPPVCDPPASTFNAHNSIVILSRDRKRMKTLVGPRDEKGLSTSYFPNPAPDRIYWMGDAILLPTKGKVRQKLFVFLHKYDKAMAFFGSAVAQLDPRTLAIEKIVEVAGLPNHEIHWGSAMLEENGFLYIYGKGIRDGRKQMFIARRPSGMTIDELTKASTWSAWDGKAWVSGLENASAIIPAGDSISDEFNVVRFTVNGRPTYIFAGIDTTVPFFSWRDITLYSSCTPQGPFTGKHAVYEMPEAGSFTVPGLAADAKLKQQQVVYNPHIHPQFSGDGRILISYNINRTHNTDSIYIDGYRPRFIYVPIKGLK